MASAVGNNSAVQNITHVYRGDGVRLYGLDAEIELKQQAKRDVNFEKQIGKWIEEVIGEKLKFQDDLIESLRSGIVLCRLLNSIIPGTIKNINTTRDTALHHMENIGLYLKACWVVGIQSSDLFVSSDLYLRKNVNAVVQNLLAISRSTLTIDGYKGPIFNGIPGKSNGNNNVQPAKKWDPITFGGPVYVTDIEARTNQQQQSPSSIDCNKCGSERVCTKCNPIQPQQPTIVTKVNSILDEKEREREKEREKELLLKIQNLSNALKDKEDGLKLLNQDLEKQRKKQLDDEKQYKDLIENQKNQILSKENLISSLNKTNSSLIMLTTNSSTTPISIPTTTTTSATSNNGSGSIISNGNKSNRNSGVFQTIASYNNKSTVSSSSIPSTTPPGGSTIISSTNTFSAATTTTSSSILNKCTRCNFTTTKTIKYCSSCGELLKKETTSTPNSSTFNKPPITSKSNIVFSTPSSVVTTTTPPQSTSPSYINNNNNNNNDEKVKTLITTMKQQEDVITNLNQQIKSDKDQFEKEKKQQKQIIDNQQILLNQKEQDLKKALSSNNNNNGSVTSTATTQTKSSFITPSNTNKGQFLLSGELKSTDSNNNAIASSFSRPIGNNSNNTTTISNKELEILREKIKSLEVKLNDEISKSKQKDSQITLLNDKVSSFNNKLKRPPPAGSNRGSQIVVVGRKRFNTLKPDTVDLTTLVDATLVHLTTILYSKPIEFYQVNSLKDLFKTEMGRRRFSQILSMTLKKVPSLQMNESSFEFLLFLVSCALQEMNLSKDNDIQSAKVLFHSSDLLYRINPKTAQSEFLKDYIRSANVYRDVTFWNEYYWSELSKRHRKVYGNVDTLDKEIINNLLSYFGTNMIYFSVQNDKVKSFITEIGQQHNLSSSQIESIINSIKDSPLYTSANGSSSTINVVSTATASSKKEKDKKKK